MLQKYLLKYAGILLTILFFQQSSAVAAEANTAALINNDIQKLVPGHFYVPADEALPDAISMATLDRQLHAWHEDQTGGKTYLVSNAGNNGIVSIRYLGQEMTKNPMAKN